MKELIQTYINCFVNRTDTWYRQWMNEQTGAHGYKYIEPNMRNARYGYQSVTVSLVEQHLLGNITCSWPLVDSNGCGKYLAFDSDLQDGQLDRLQDAWLDYGWYVIRTKGRNDRDGHLFICMDKAIEAKYLICLGDVMMKQAKVSGIERFPKTINGSSQLRGPLGINLKPKLNKPRDLFVAPGLSRDIREQLVWLNEQTMNDADIAIQRAKEHTVNPPPVKLIRKRVNNHYQKINILDFLQARRVGKEYVAQCPLCAAEGHDHHKDNLKISSDGKKFCCWYLGASQVHKTLDIIRTIRKI